MENLIPLDQFEHLIFEFRGIKVMLDVDLAILYETETKKLKQQVRRNIERFPDDFMFELTQDEKESLVNIPRLANLKYTYFMPMAFTEQGVAMLSSVISSARAVQVNIWVMRAFVRYRSHLVENKELREEIWALDNKMDHAFNVLLDKINALTPEYTKRKKVEGFRRRTGRS